MKLVRVVDPPTLITQSLAGATNEERIRILKRMVAWEQRQRKIDRWALMGIFGGGIGSAVGMVALLRHRRRVGRAR